MGTKTWAAACICLVLLQINWGVCQKRIPPWVTTQSVPLQGPTFLHLARGKAVPYYACYTIRNNALNDLPFQVDTGSGNVENFHCSDILTIGIPCKILVDDFTVSSDLFSEILSCKLNDAFVELPNGILLSYDLFCDQINSEEPRIAVPKLPILPAVDYDLLVSRTASRKVRPNPIVKKPVFAPAPVVPTKVGNDPFYAPTLETEPITFPYRVQPYPSKTNLPPYPPEPCVQPPPNPCSQPCLPQTCVPEISCQPAPCEPEPCLPQPYLPVPNSCPPEYPGSPSPCLPEPCALPISPPCPSQNYPYAPSPCESDPCPPQPCLPQPYPPVPCQPHLPEPCPPQPCLSQPGAPFLPSPTPYLPKTSLSVSPCSLTPCLPQPCSFPIPPHYPIPHSLPEPCPPELCLPKPCPPIHHCPALCEYEPISLWDHYIHPPINCIPTPAHVPYVTSCGSPFPYQCPFSTMYPNSNTCNFNYSPFRCPLDECHYSNIIFA